MMTSPNSLAVENLSVSYPNSKEPALQKVTLNVAASSILSIVGASGSGKSTLLRALCGLESPASGTIKLGGQVLCSSAKFVRPDRRKIGLVSQSGDLFPHLNVFQNLGYGLTNWRRADRKTRCKELLEAIGLPNFEKRFPHELSGGEKQRIALARALAPRPPLLLLDEPFSNLDSNLRQSLRRLTADILRKEKTTTIFVTHHPEDALSTGDSIAVMDSGTIIQCDTPRNLWRNPVSPVAASLFDKINQLPSSNFPNWLRANELELVEESHGGFTSGIIHEIEFFGKTQMVYVKIQNNLTPVIVEVASEEKYQIGSPISIKRKRLKAIQSKRLSTEHKQGICF
ncbi:ABC transporter ATP-binding protein [Akkermansiaceae bacterium]|jgi:iron(III) transport system ATP-binding protein|nr:ABC transporter ATP-binding protein [Akkermansiaceae bacterium]MDB4638360.1 ABC transporter ATP-binding protein [bacterium]MDB4707138.1 ABC transporter ATP-binding protein [Akkermansiaceae bacterium]MDB4761318.1 ABC transporter ATP-binding protein [Akkermansiaceae bacterium]MDB4802972.1 ABC transporter ATP-binding protein [bacterium]